MATNSSQAGYLTPSTQPLTDQGLEDFLHGVIVGMTGLPATLVRPRWQSEPIQRPDFSVDWCSFGEQSTSADFDAYENHGGPNDPTVVERDEMIRVIHSFYGPNAGRMATRFRNGFSISQNRDALSAGGLAVSEVQDALKIPALLAERWVPKIDVVVVYRRRSSLTYPILSIQSGHATIDAEVVTSSVNANP